MRTALRPDRGQRRAFRTTAHRGKPDQGTVHRGRRRQRPAGLPVQSPGRCRRSCGRRRAAGSSQDRLEGAEAPLSGGSERGERRGFISVAPTALHATATHQTFWRCRRLALTRCGPSAGQRGRQLCSVCGRSPPQVELTVCGTLRSLSLHANSGPNDRYPRYCRHSQRSTESMQAWRVRRDAGRRSSDGSPRVYGLWSGWKPMCPGPSCSSACSRSTWSTARTAAASSRALSRSSSNRSSRRSSRTWACRQERRRARQPVAGPCKRPDAAQP